MGEFFVEDGVLVKYTGAGGDVVVPADVTAIGDRAFYDCGSLKSVTLPAGLTEIGEKAFYGCGALTSVTVPEGVTRIGEEAFYGCDALKRAALPASLTEIGDFAFPWGKGLTIHAPAGSCAEQNARERGIAFEAIEEA